MTKLYPPTPFRGWDHRPEPICAACWLNRPVAWLAYCKHRKVAAVLPTPSEPIGEYPMLNTRWHFHQGDDSLYGYAVGLTIVAEQYVPGSDDGAA